MHGTLSFPFLLALAWLIAGLLWWDHHKQVITQAHMPWMMLAMALVVVAMTLALAKVPAPWQEQVIRVALLLEGIIGFRILRHRQRKRARNE